MKHEVREGWLVYHAGRYKAQGAAYTKKFNETKDKDKAFISSILACHYYDAANFEEYNRLYALERGTK